MPSFADSIFLFVLALLLFGPKKLPVLARELGKWMGEFRRASNEFKLQMEEELRASENAERQKKVAAMEAAAPIPPPLEDPPEPAHPHLRAARGEGAHVPAEELELESSASSGAPAAEVHVTPEPAHGETQAEVSESPLPAPAEEVRPVPIAVSGSLHMMPPATGLPTPRTTRPGRPAAPATDAADALSVPEPVPSGATSSLDAEGVHHAD